MQTKQQLKQALHDYKSAVEYGKRTKCNRKVFLKYLEKLSVDYDMEWIKSIIPTIELVI